MNLNEKMKFHKIACGSNVSIIENDTKAKRIDLNIFTGGLVFSNEKIIINKPITVNISYNQTFFKGSLIIGLTARNPVEFLSSITELTDLSTETSNSSTPNNSTSSSTTPMSVSPSTSMPVLIYSNAFTLNQEDDIWLKSITIDKKIKNFRLVLNSQQEFLLIVSNEQYKIIFSELPSEPLYLIFDLLGHIDYIDLNEININNLNIPKRILTMGETIVSNFKEECRLSSIEYNSARIFLIGPPYSGKSSLKKAFLSLSTENIEKTDGLDNKQKCNSDFSGYWTNEEMNETFLPDRWSAHCKEIFAYNTALSILMKKEANTENIDDIDNGDDEDSKNNNSNRNQIKLHYDLLKNAINEQRKVKNVNGIDELDEQINEIIPDAYQELIQSYLAEYNNVNELIVSSLSSHSIKDEFSDFDVNNIAKYTIWDLSGDMIYFSINQILLTTYAVYILVIDISEDLETPIDQAINNVETRKNDLSTIKLIHYWLNAIYSRFGSAESNDDNKSILSNSKSTSGNKINIEDMNGNKSNDDNNDDDDENDGNKKLERKEEHSKLLFSKNKNRIDSSSYANNNNNINNNNEQMNESSFPKVIIIGTHRNSVHLEPITRDQIIRETNEKILQSIDDKPYRNLIERKIYSIDCSQMSCDEPKIINCVREKIDEIFLDENLIKFDIPYSWFELGCIIDRLTKRNILFADINQLYELTRAHIDNGLFSIESLEIALDFYHTHGKIFCFSSTYLNFNETLIILNPKKFLNYFYKLCNYILNDDNANDKNATATATNENKDNISSLTKETIESGMVKDELFDKVWYDTFEQKMILIGCLERLDIICELSSFVSIDEQTDTASNISHPKRYLFPWITQILPESLNRLGLEYELYDKNTFYFIVDFNDRLPIGLFSRLIVRLARWSWSQGWERKPDICHSEARIAIDFDHDLLLKLRLSKSIIKLYVIKIIDDAEQGSIVNGPNANICIKVRHLIETELEILQTSFYRKMIYSLRVPCPCDKICDEHQKSHCSEENCEHYLLLNDCINFKIVECEYRQVRTNFVTKYFPMASFYSTVNESRGSENQFNSNEYNGVLYDILSGWENIFNAEPSWMRDASVMLFNNHSRDWVSLGKRLGYTDRDISKLNEEVTPPLALLRDWYESNGRTRYSIDVLISCLRMISRDDVANAIEEDVEPEGSSPPVFISYQSDSQELVLDLRRRLEISGFPCWMDISLMGGGDSLYGKIYEGISRAKVVVCCLTPRYIVSRLCIREVALADVLHKPILPLILEPTPWPPPGPMAVVMSSLVYVDLCGIGGHGGIGMRADSETRFREILERITRYMTGFEDTPLLNRNIQMSNIFTPVHNRTPRNALFPPPTSPNITDSINEELVSGRASSAQEETQSEGYGNDENLIEDSLSVASQVQQNNRIVHCSVCTIL